MMIHLTVNGRNYPVDVNPADMLLDVLRQLGFKSVQRGCDTSNCGLCSVLADGQPVLSCATLAIRAEGRKLETIEGLTREVERVASCLAGEGADQCGFCSPGLILSVIALKRTLPPQAEWTEDTISDETINAYLMGNLCRCTGYVGQLRAIRKYLADADQQPASRQKPNPAGISGSDNRAASDISGGDSLAAANPNLQAVGQSIEKLDSRANLHGKAVYTDDLATPDALVVKILRSPHAHALIRNIDTRKASRVPGVELILTWADVPQTRFTLAGQSYPEPSPYDRLILDREVRYVGDEVAIIAADTERNALKAMRLIKVDYEVRPAVLTMDDALKGEIQVHKEHEMVFNLPQPVGGHDIAHNIMGAQDHRFGTGDETTFASCDVVLERTYQTQAQAHSMMETFRTFTTLDQWNRLVVISSTQVPFHIKRQLALALELPTSRIRVIKPRVGGGFGAKQSSVTEIFPAIVTLKTGKPAKIVYTRQESYMASNSRHAMRAIMKIGASRDGTIRALTIDTLSDQGAYSLHGWTTVGLVGEKSLPLYNKLEYARFQARVLYTHKMPAGAFRGYGATQGAFFVESIVNELSAELKIDPIELRLRNIVHEGETTVAFGKQILSSALDRCILKGKELIGWEQKYPRQVFLDGRIRAVGMAITMQGSGIAHVDTSTVKVQLNESGDFSLFMSPTDVGTGTDTILTQMAAEILQTRMHNIIPIVADTDITPYDPGSYASSGTYVTGRAVVAACQDLKRQILEVTAERYHLNRESLDLNDGVILQLDPAVNEPTTDPTADRAVIEGIGPSALPAITLRDLAEKLSVGPQGKTLVGVGSFGSQTSPPPYMAGFAEIELDPATGETQVVNFVGVVDCGRVINPNLARLQAEGGIVQGIGLALFEEVRYGERGQIATNSFLQYKIPTRSDIGQLQVAFEETHEPTGPFGAKSIGEIVINTPAPAIADAIYNACGVRLRQLPMLPQNVWAAIQEI
jgi:CO/xanthine dehydrogenase Mo-binding subunit/aerobic-type carbon monoxide dehydrogenase small subunit (CoxS/CutS family)